MNMQEVFPYISKAEWLAQITKDLKGKDPVTLNWALTERLSVSPLVSAEDFAQLPTFLTDAPNEWDICELVTVQDPAAANAQALEALRLGAQSIRFHLDTPPDAASLSTLLQDIYIDFISLHFEGPGVSSNPGGILALLALVAKERNIPTANLRGSLGYAPDVQATFTDWRYLGELISFAQISFPGFQVIQLTEESSTDPEQGLAILLQRSQLYLKNLTERGCSTEAAAQAIHFSIAIGPLYFVEIARIRAFKLLWLNLLQGWGLPRKYPVVSAVFAPAVYSDDIYTNMIKATTMAMSAALGGATTITVRPYDEGRENLSAHSGSFARRIARNVQHLLKMESGFDQVSDPAAGSYYLEHLTAQIGTTAWELFKG
jgi:methylmalonyl-CoA mutase